jgi:hypothetical protein
MKQARRPWARSKLLCLRAADQATGRAIPGAPAHCVSNAVVSRLVRELAPKHAELGLAAGTWRTSGRRTGLKPGDSEEHPAVPGYAIDAGRVANMVQWCVRVVTEARPPFLRSLQLAWAALHGDKEFDANALQETVLPELRALETYCRGVAAGRQGLVAWLRAPKRTLPPRPRRVVPAVWNDILREQPPPGWTLYPPQRARQAVFGAARYLHLAERGTGESIFSCIEPADGRFFLSTDSVSLVAIDGDVRTILRSPARTGHRSGR